MSLCKYCGKWVAQPEGRRQKDFCNSTCRSNFWYGKNKKKIKFAPVTEAAYDGKKGVHIYDQPEFPQQPYKTVADYMAWKRDIDNESEYKQFCRDVELNPNLSRKEKDFCKIANPSQL